MHTTSAPRLRPRPRSVGWAVVSAIGCLLVAGYFFVAAGLARLTLFGTEATPFQLARSHQDSSAAGLALVAAPITALAAFALHRWLVQAAIDHDRRPPTTLGLLLGWVLAFTAAFPLTQLLPGDGRPLGFGIVWGLGGAVVGPLVITVGAVVSWHGSVPAPPPPPPVDRSSTPWWSGE